MTNKIYIALLAVAVVATGSLTFYGYSWLSSIGDPKAAFDGFQYYQGLEWGILWPAAVVLLVVGNVVLWSSGRAWAIWLTFVYFAAFILVRYFWTGPAGFEFRRGFDPSAGKYDFSVLLGVVFVVLAAAIVYFDQYLVKRLRDRMNPIATDEAEPQVDAESEVVQ